ncbi:hypothetical protein GCM10027562_15510 [Arthrobacter pigmenti]
MQGGSDEEAAGIRLRVTGVGKSRSKGTGAWGADDMENPLPSPQNALTLDEYESLTSARAEFVDFLLGASVEAADDDGSASEHGPGAKSAGHDGGQAVAEPRQAGAE